MLPSCPACAPLCDSCSSGQCFAYRFLQIPPHDGHPCVWLTVPSIRPVAVLHRLVNAPCRAQSSRRQDCSRRPLTPPYVRFRIRRFLSSFTFVLYACSLMTTQPPLVDSVHYLRLRPSCEVSGQTIRMSNWLPRQIQPFIVLRQLLWPLLTSAVHPITLRQ